MRMKNLHQASVFILEGVPVLDCGIDGKVAYIVFDENDETYKKVMKNWQDKKYLKVKIDK